MKTRTLCIGLLIAVAAGHWILAGQMVLGSERILQKGTPYKFRCAPLDPEDPFRGKFIVLQFDAAIFKTDTGSNFQTGQAVFLLLKKDTAGFAHIDKVSAQKPEGNTGWLTTSISYIDRNKADTIQTLHFDLPFTRYYMDEFDAPKAEKEYAHAVTDTSRRTWAQVHIWQGEARIAEVFVRDTSLRQRFGGSK